MGELPPRNAPVGLGPVVRAADQLIEAAVAEIDRALADIEADIPELIPHYRRRLSARFAPNSAPPFSVNDEAQPPIRRTPSESLSTNHTDPVAYGHLFRVISNDICAFLEGEVTGLSVDDIHQLLDHAGRDIKRTTLIKYLRRMTEIALIRTRSRGHYVLNEQFTTTSTDA